MATSVMTNPIIGGGGKYKLKSVTRVNIGIGQSETFTPTKNGNLIVYNSDILSSYDGYRYDKIWLDGVEIQPSYFYKTTFEFDTNSTSNQYTKYVSIPSFGSIKIDTISDNQGRSGYIYEYEPMD